jgi:hypothetical protein
MSAMCLKCHAAPGSDEYDGLCGECNSELDAEERAERRAWRRRTIVVTPFSAIKAETTRWLWQDRVPLGAATLLVGHPKLGKSTLTVELAARLSQGELDGDLHGSPADALLISYEDSASRTVKPRLLAAKADLAHVHRVQASREGVPDLVSLPEDVAGIRELVLKTGARLLVVDPLSASLGTDINNHRDQDMRRALAPLMQLAEEADLALVVVAHFNKGTGGDALSRTLGSRGLTAAVRSILAFGRSPDAENGSPDRVLAHAACNVGPEAPSLECRIAPYVLWDGGEPISTSRLEIVRETDATADSLLITRGESERDSDGDGEQSKLDAAVAFLEDELAGGPLLANELRASARELAVSPRTLERAKDALGVEHGRVGGAK